MRKVVRWTIGNVGPRSPTLQLVETCIMMIICSNIESVGLDTYASQLPYTALKLLFGVAGGVPAHSLVRMGTPRHLPPVLRCYPLPPHSLDDNGSLVVTTLVSKTHGD